MSSCLLFATVSLLTLFQLTYCAVLINVPNLQLPKPEEAAKMARYIMRNIDWLSLATISAQKELIQGYPFVSLKSVSDGPENNSTGVPYLYLTEMDVSGRDIAKDNRCTIMGSLAELDYCKQHTFDPQDPRCAKLIITGRMIKIDKDSAEYAFGQSALYYKHPVMKKWPNDHQFYVAKVNIEQILVLDYFGGTKNVTIQDYFNANDVLFTNVPFVAVNA